MASESKRNNGQGPNEGLSIDNVETDHHSWKIENLRIGLVTLVVVLAAGVVGATLWAAVRIVEIVVNGPR